MYYNHFDTNDPACQDSTSGFVMPQEGSVSQGRWKADTMTGKVHVRIPAPDAPGSYLRRTCSWTVDRAEGAGPLATPRVGSFPTASSRGTPTP
jgi:hypothetical protein